MVRKIALGLVAAAAISTAALAPTAASAKPFGMGGGFGGGFGGGWHHHHIGGLGLGIGLIGAGVASSCYVSQPVLTPFGYRYQLVNVCY
jgi:hypothetical protein